MPAARWVGLTLRISWYNGRPDDLTWKIDRHEWQAGKTVLTSGVANGELIPRIRGDRTLDVALGLLRAALEAAQEEQRNFHPDPEQGLRIDHGERSRET